MQLVFRVLGLVFPYRKVPVKFCFAFYFAFCAGHLCLRLKFAPGFQSQRF